MDLNSADKRLNTIYNLLTQEQAEKLAEFRAYFHIEGKIPLQPEEEPLAAAGRNKTMSLKERIGIRYIAERILVEK